MVDLDHALHVSELSGRIAGKLGLSEKDTAIITISGMFHDIGKMGIPSALLDKPTALTKDEYKLIQWHTTMGHLILSNMPDEIHRAAAEAALYHHERLNGSGYTGLFDKQIPTSARIIAVADVFDALTTDRPYRKAWPAFQALEYLSLRAGTEFDAHIVDALTAVAQ